MSSFLGLPVWLNQAIEALTSEIPAHQLQEAYKALSERYRFQSEASGYGSSLEPLAYTIARLPATYAAVKRCLQEIPDSFQPKSLLDVGSGSGSATYAILELFSSLEKICLVESDSSAIQVGKKLLSFLEEDHCDIQYHQGNALQLSIEETYHMTVASYVYGEMAPDQRRDLFLRTFQQTKELYLIVLPGTPKGFSVLLELRSLALEQGATLLAPCPHHLNCPLGEGDWCHFPVRLPRTTWHKHLKNGGVGYEDEKFCYLLLSKIPQKRDCTARVIKRPKHHGGHGSVDLCTQGKLETASYSRKKTSDYSRWKNLEWGDCFKLDLK